MGAMFPVITKIRKMGKVMLFNEGLMNQTLILKNLYPKVGLINQAPTIKNEIFISLRSSQ